MNCADCGHPRENHKRQSYNWQSKCNMCKCQNYKPEAKPVSDYKAKVFGNSLYSKRIN